MIYFHYFHLFSPKHWRAPFLQYQSLAMTTFKGSSHSIRPFFVTKTLSRLFPSSPPFFFTEVLKKSFLLITFILFQKTLNMAFLSVVRSFSLALLISPSFLLVHFSFTEALKGSLYITFYTFFPPKSLVSPYIHYLHSSSLPPFFSTGPQDKQPVHNLQCSFKTESLNRTLHFPIPIFNTEVLCWPHFFITHSVVHRSP